MVIANKRIYTAKRRDFSGDHYEKCRDFTKAYCWLLDDECVCTCVTEKPVAAS